MIGRGPDPEHVVARTRERCRVALMGNHDYAATGAASRRASACRARPRALARRWPASASRARSRVDAHAPPGGAPRRRAVLARRARATPSRVRGGSNAAACLATQRGRSASSRTPTSRPRGARRRGAPRPREDPRRRARPPGRQVAAQPGRGRRAVPPRRGWFATSTPRRPTARSGCCSTSTNAPRPGGARRTTRGRRGSGPARSGSTTPDSARPTHTIGPRHGHE